MPVVSVSLQTETKIRLDALSVLLQAPLSRTVEVLVSSYIDALPTPEAQLLKRLTAAAVARQASDAPAGLMRPPAPAVSYKFSRLCFKRDLIEALGPNDAFRVETPVGTFQMTQTDFHRVFRNVAESRSYLDAGLYHYRKLPKQAEQFRVR